MRLVSIGPRGGEQPGVMIDDERLLLVTPVLARHGIRSGDWAELLGSWSLIAPILADALVEHMRGTALTVEVVPTHSVRLGPPITRPSTIVAIGFNFAAHGDGVLGSVRPTGEPVVFLKPVTSLSGPDDDVVLPPETRELDYEVELAVVIGRGGRRIDAEHAAGHIAGYMIANDFSARDVAFGSGAEHPLLFQIARAKGFPSFCPTGPWLLTADEMPDAGELGMRLSVNDEKRQDWNTSQMSVGIADLIASVSSTMELRPGDILLTGTPPGCGFQQDPPTYLRDGDIVEATIDRLGRMRNRVRDEAAMR